MDATLCDTVGSHVVNNKRNRGGGSVLASAPPKAPAKGPLPRPAATVTRPHKGTYETSSGAGAGPGGHIPSVSVSPSGAAELKPLLVLNGDAHPAAIVPSPSFISSPRSSATTSLPASFGSAGTTGPNASRHGSHGPTSFSSGPFRLNATSHGNSKNLLGLSSPFPATVSCLASPAATSAVGGEGQSQKGGEEEPAFRDGVAHRRLEAREKRRERREARMTESLGRIATALELLSSKQDTVIALLQRLADRMK